MIKLFRILYAAFQKGFFLPLLFVVASSLLLANTLPHAPEISADEPLIFDKERDALIATGNATLRYDDSLLGADELVFFQSQGVFLADNNLYLNTSKIRAIAQDGSYQLSGKVLTCNNFRLISPPQCLQGPTLHSEASHITASRSVLYLGEPDLFCLNLYSQEAKGDTKESITLKHAVLRVGKVPFFWFPHITLKEYPFTISQEYGKAEIGTYLRNTIFYKPGGPCLKKAGMLLDFYDTTGVFLGPAYNYTSSTAKSSLRSGYLHDRRSNRKKDSLDNDIPKDRYAIEFRHIQSIQENFSLNTKISAWSDSEILRHTRPSYYNKDRAPDNFLEGVYLGENYVFSTFTRFKPNNFILVQERLPEVSFHYLPTPIAKTKLYQESKLGFSNVLERPLDDAPNTHIYKLDAYYGLSRSFHPNDWLSIVPVVGCKMNRYGAYEGDNRAFTWVSGEFGFDVELKSYSAWDYQNKTWEIDGIRHICKPLVQYRVLPLHKSGNASLASIDRQIATTHLDPLELSQMRKTDPSQGTHILRLGLNNLVQTKKGSDYQVAQLADFSIFQDINCTRKEGDKTLSNTHNTLSLTPASWLNCSLYQRINPRSLNTKELNTSTSIKNADEWVFTFTSSYLEEETLQYGLGFRYNFTVRHAFAVRFVLNERLQQVTSQHYSYITRLGHNWDVVYSASFSKNTNLESHEKYSFAFRWKP